MGMGLRRTPGRPFPQYRLPATAQPRVPSPRTRCRALRPLHSRPRNPSHLKTQLKPSVSPPWGGAWFTILVPQPYPQSRLQAQAPDKPSPSFGFRAKPSINYAAHAHRFDRLSLALPVDRPFESKLAEIGAESTMPPIVYTPEGQHLEVMTD